MILSFSINCQSLEQFLNHWSDKYRYVQFNEDKYRLNIGRALTDRSRQELFEWKNGSRLSVRKTESVRRNYPLCFDKQQLRHRYLNPDLEGGPIWNIFYMHCIDRHTWPIFDQHTYRAMHFMKTGKIKELTSNRAAIFDIYETEYREFMASLGCEQKKTDQALYAFGQFLKKADRYC